MTPAELDALGIPRKRIVVGFAGGGGACFGLRQAYGVDPDAALNHWHVAIDAHRRHFPNTGHYLGDIIEVSPRIVCPGEPVGFAWFSPDCTDHSKAKGKAPKSERIRGLAWCILPWVAQRRPDVLMLENVEEWFDWGPVYRRPDDCRANGVRGEVGQPIRALRGQTRERFVRRLERLGGVVEIRYLVAADYGDPTTRKRLVLIARFDGLPIVWPAPTHAPRKLAAERGLKPWRGAAECIDFSEPCPSIFLTHLEARDLRRAGGPSCKRPLVANTMKRVARGVDRYVVGSAEPFIIPVTHAGDARVSAAVDPLKTLTASSRGDFAVVDPVLAPFVGELAHGDHPRGAGERVRDARDPVRTIHAAGGSHAVVAPVIVRSGFQSAAGRNGVRDPQDPLATADSGGGFAQVSAFLVPRYGERDGQEPRVRDVAEPYPSPVPDGNGGSLAAVHLSRQFGRSVGSAAADPVGVMTPGGGGKTALVAAALGRQFGSNVSGRDVAEPLASPASGGGKGGGHDQLIAASLSTYYGTGTGSDAAEPMRAVTSEDRHALIAVWLEQAATGLVGHPAQDPLSTIVGKGCTQRLVEARMELEGGAQGRRGQVLEFLWDQFGAPTAEEWADPTGTHAARLKFGIVMIAAQVWLIVDIGLRMLKARELARAMGLPADVDFETDADGRPISTTHQVEMIGNMVCPGVVRAVAEVNAPDWEIPAGWRWAA